ncbi:MAG: UDP-2,3-diacylglucosamine diphosphatase LpxI [Hydrotalea sp.]|nr:UDP-2,3-diacylglucosamine diphosphatase LpxI [Hydrotalea sp.]
MITLPIRNLAHNLAMAKKKKTIAMFSGFDNTPILLWKNARARGDVVLPILFPEFAKRYPAFWRGKEKSMLSIGQLGKLIAFLKEHQVTHFMIVGRLERLPLKELKLDMTAKIFLAQNIGVYGKGDDALLSALARFIAKKTNSQLLSPTEYLQGGEKITKGLFAGREPATAHWQDFKKGQRLLQAISKFDIGQAVVMADGLVLAIETMAGTDAMIQTTKPFTRQRDAVLVKDFKRGQNKKVDAPSLGPDTILAAHRADLKGIFFNHRGNIIEPAKTKKLAEQHKLFIYLF